MISRVLALSFCLLTACSPGSPATCSTTGASCSAGAGTCLQPPDGGALACMLPCGDARCALPATCITIERNGQVQMKCYLVE